MMGIISGQKLKDFFLMAEKKPGLEVSVGRVLPLRPRFPRSASPVYCFGISRSSWIPGEHRKL